MEAVNEYMIAMKRSGYSQRVRKETAIAAFKTFNRRVKECKDLGRPIYRNVDEGASERHKNKISLKSNWFNKKRKQNQILENNHQSNTKNSRRKNKTKPVIPTTKIEQDSRPIENVIFVPYTQRGDLKKQLQKVDDRVTKLMGVGRTKYVERAGITLRDQLVTKNIWQTLLGGCQRPNCFVCRSTSGKGISCRAEGTCYQISCKQCEKQKKRTVYIGETSRSTYERMYEHFWLFKKRKEGDVEKGEANSVLWNHSKDKHASSMLSLIHI